MSALSAVCLPPLLKGCRNSCLPGGYLLHESLCTVPLRNSLSNSPCPGRARGRGRYILLARAIKNKPFQCSDGCDSEQIPLFYPRGCAAPLLGIAAIATLERFVLYCSCEQNISAAPPGAAQRARGIAQAVSHSACTRFNKDVRSHNGSQVR